MPGLARMPANAQDASVVTSKPAIRDHFKADRRPNPSILEQRTGRADQIGSKAERCGLPIQVLLPFIGETQDEKMYRVVMDGERWFQVLMGERYRLDLQSTEKMAERVPFPECAASDLAFDLAVTPFRNSARDSQAYSSQFPGD